MKKKVVVRIDLDTAECVVEAVGYNGKGCRDATAGLERLLGNVTDRETKPVMWNQTAETHAVVEGKK